MGDPHADHRRDQSRPCTTSSFFKNLFYNSKLYILNTFHTTITLKPTQKRAPSEEINITHTYIYIYIHMKDINKGKQTYLEQT